MLDLPRVLKKERIEVIGMGDTYRNYQATKSNTVRITEYLDKMSEPIGYYYSYTVGKDRKKENIKIIEYIYDLQPQEDISMKFHFIHNEREAYIWMRGMQDLKDGQGRILGVEIVEVLSINQTTGKKGVLILPWYKNTYKTSSSMKASVGLTMRIKTVSDIPHWQ